MPPYLSPGVYVEEVPPAVRPISGAGTSTLGIVGTVNVSDDDPLGLPFQVDPAEDSTEEQVHLQQVTLQDEGQPKLVTSWAQFISEFAGLTGDDTVAEDEKDTVARSDFDNDYADALNQWRAFAHAVLGFFYNGGTRCYATWVSNAARISTNWSGDNESVLGRFARIDEIAIVAAPATTDTQQTALLDHCGTLKDRVAVLDGPDDAVDHELTTLNLGLGASEWGALYFPWVEVFDPGELMLNPDTNGNLLVPPSGHVAGVYARVDTDYGPHKAPANEVINGALAVPSAHVITRAEQDGLNPKGVNIIRPFNGSIKIWGARTLGGEDNTHRYISTRRYLSYLMESIDEGTQWVVFEPHTTGLWARVKRSVGGFLLNEWRAGRLFGETPDQAYFVKCDEETNPQSTRDLGQLITEVGVALVKPAEFVIFRIEQMTNG